MKILRMICNFIIIIAAGIGLYIDITHTNDFHVFLYFTTQSNIWILLISLLFFIYDLLNKNITINMYKVKYIFTIAILLTGLVYNFVLVPQFTATTFKVYGLSPTLLHVVTPLFALISYFFDDNSQISKKFYWAGITLPLLYFIFTMILSLFYQNSCLYGYFEGHCTNFPYFFLNYIEHGWFTLSTNITKLGVFYWFIIIFIIVVLFSKLIFTVNSKIKVKR